MNNKFLEFYKKYSWRVKLLLTIILLIVIYLLLPILPFITIGAFLAYLNYPFYKRLKKILKKDNLSAFITTLLTLLLVILPLIYLILELTNQLFAFYQEYGKKNILIQEDTVKLIYYIIPYETLREKLLSLIESSGSYLFKKLSSTVIDILTAIPTLLFKSLIVIISQFYFITHGRNLISIAEKYLPFGPVYNIIIIKNLQKTINSLVYGLIFPALAQTIALLLILIILGVDINYLLVALFTLIFSLIPSIGSWVVWIPIAIKLWFISKIKAIVLFLYGIFIVSNIDNLTRILVTSKVGHIPFWIVLFATLGGLLSNGITGMILAIFFSSLAYYLWKDIIIYGKEE